MAASVDWAHVSWVSLQQKLGSVLGLACFWRFPYHEVDRSPLFARPLTVASSSGPLWGLGLGGSPTERFLIYSMSIRKKHS